MNRSGQSGILLGVFTFIIGVAIWAVFLGNQLAVWGEYVITNSNLTGAEAFFYANLNLWYFLILIIAMIVFFSLGGGNE